MSGQGNLLDLAPRFDGPDVTPKDAKRLSRQLDAVRELMADGEWRTLAVISKRVGCSEASASARLRDLRKPRFGGFEVQRMRLALDGLFAYRVVPKGGAQ